VVVRKGCLVVAVALVALTAGCTAGADRPVQTPERNATLSLSGYERTHTVSTVETRGVWDRSKNWEDPGERNMSIHSRAHAYRAPGDTDSPSVVVYTTPNVRYTGADRLSSMSPADLAALATTPVGDAPAGTARNGSHTARLLGDRVSVRTLVDPSGTPTAHVATATDPGVAVIVVVSGEADRATIDRILEGVTLSERVASDAEPE
jgi:hypothetical protein